MPLKKQAEKAIRYLSEDSLSHIDMLEPIRRGTADILYAENDGVILYERSSGVCMISMRSLESCQSIIDFKKYRLFAVHQKRIAEWIQQEGKIPHIFQTSQAAYRKKESVAACFDAIRVLTSDFTDFVWKNYETMDDRAYIENLIGRQQLWGIFDDGAPAGFAGEHLEGSMGLLQVLPAYRRKGYGYRLEAFLINRFFNLNEIPFCQVKADNIPSLALQKKIGMEISRQPTFWVTE